MTDMPGGKAPRKRRPFARPSASVLEVGLPRWVIWYQLNLCMWGLHQVLAEHRREFMRRISHAVAGGSSACHCFCGVAHPGTTRATVCTGLAQPGLYRVVESSATGPMRVPLCGPCAEALQGR